MKRESLIILLSVLLLIVTFMLSITGCSCFHSTESFTNPDMESKDNKKHKDPEDADLTKEEIALFEDIKSGSVTDTDIQKMIDSNLINETLITKFMKKIDTLSDTSGSKASSSPVSKPSKPVEKPSKADHDDVEPFFSMPGGQNMSSLPAPF